MRKQPQRGGARTQRIDAGQSYEAESGQHGMRLAFSSGAKTARSLANFQGRSAPVDLESAGGGQRVGQLSRPRPGKIEVPQSTSAPLGSPGGIPPESGGNRTQQAPSSPRQAPIAQKSLMPSGPSAQEVTRFTSVPEEHRSYGSFLHSNLTARPQSPHNDRELQGVGSPRQFSPRPAPTQQPSQPQQQAPPQQPPNLGRLASPVSQTTPLSSAMAPGQKLGLQLQKSSGPPKIAFGRSVYTAPDQFSAMSTVSVASISEESVPARKFKPLQRSQSASALSSRGMGSSPQKSYAWRNRLLDQGYRDNFLGGTSRSPTSARSHAMESPRAGKNEAAACTWGKAPGHTGFVSPYFDRGLRRADHTRSALGGTAATVEIEEHPCSARAITEIGKRMTDGLETKLSMTCPADARSLPDRLCPSEHVVAGVATPKCYNNRTISKCWEPPVAEDTSNLGESSASASSTCMSKRMFPERRACSANIKAGLDHDTALQASVKSPTQGHEVHEDFFKSVHGRSMRLGRQLSEPPSARAPESTRKHTRRMLHDKDYTKGESVGGAAPCISPEILRKSETHASLPFEHRGQGEFKLGNSDYSHKLSVQNNSASFRIEHHVDRALNERSASTSALQESARAGHFGQPPWHEGAAGMTTHDLGKAASMQNLQAEKSRGKNCGHLESPVMTSILKNAVAKDADRIRAFRTTYDQPFRELCSAFDNIRESHNRDAQRIRREVCMNSSHNVANALRHSPRSQSCGAEVRTARSHPKDSPAAGSPSRGRFTPAHTPLSSLQMEAALRWVC